MLGFMSNYLKWIIVAGGVIVLFFLIKNYVKLYSKKTAISDAMHRNNKESYINANTQEIKEREIKEAVTPDTIRSYEKSFNEVVSAYNACVQFIPLFPLLGILGTVAGLMLALGDSSEVAEVNNVAMRTAFETTFYGLIVTIILRICATAPAKLIEDTEIDLDDYDKKFDNSVKLGNITSE